MKMNKALSFFVIFLLNNVIAQKKAESNAVFENISASIDSSKSIIIIGENHYRNNFDYQTKILAKLITENKIKKVGLEVGFGYSLFLSNYLLTGDQTIFELLKWEKYGSSKVYHETIRFIKWVKMFNSSLDSSKRITIFGFDVPAYDITRTRLLFEKMTLTNKMISETNIITILNSNPNTKINSYEAEVISQKLIADFTFNYLKYKQLLTHDFELVERIIEGMKITFDAGYLDNFEMDKKRELYIANNLINEVQNEERVVVFTGNAHLTLLKGDTMDYLYPFNSFSYSLSEIYPNKVYTLCTQWLTRRKLISFLRDNNLLNCNPRDLFRIGHSHYRFFDSLELKNHPEASKRYHGLILIDGRKFRW
jgi:hypothetical protein